MRAFMIICTLILSISTCMADVWSDSLNAQTRALNAGTIYRGINTGRGVANTVSDIKTNATLRQRIETETTLIKKQAALKGIDLRSAADIRNEREALYEQSRYYLIRAKKEAKYENDEEMLTLIKKYWKPWTAEDAIYAAEKVMELKEKRKQKKSL